MVREYEINLKNYTFLNGTTCSCILDLMHSRCVLLKSTCQTNKLYQPKLHCYIPLVLILQEVSIQNSSNRRQQRTVHLMGSKNSSQCSFEQVIITYTNMVLLLYDAIIVYWIAFLASSRDQETVEEPSDHLLWRTTHTKHGRWSNPVSAAVYVSKSSVKPLLWLLALSSNS